TLAPVVQLAQARTLLAQGQLTEAINQVEPLVATLQASERYRLVLEALLVQTLIYQAQEETDQAIKTLERALKLGEPAGYLRSFLDEGSALLPLLQTLKGRGTGSLYAQQLSTLLEAQTQQSMPQPLIEPLSERELEILTLIADGLANRQIAEQLYLTVGTVKWHLNNIYGKLGVRRRTQAVARARELQLL
ncbi:MAG: LuxR C-terminal-related transcriptional regulator, partial [Chloroflexota bacterium]